MKKRSYKQQCALARALDMVGERWTFLIIRELIIAPKRYKTLGENLKGMGTNLLATRLKELEAQGVIERTPIPDSKLFAYQLSEFGRELEEPLLAIIRWGFKLPIADESEFLSVAEWDLVAMKAAFRPERVVGLDVLVEFDLDGLVFFVEIKAQKVNITLKSEVDATVFIHSSVADLMKISTGELTFDQAVEGKLVRFFCCERDVVEQVLGCFSVV